MAQGVVTNYLRHTAITTDADDAAGVRYSSLTVRALRRIVGPA